MSTSALLPMVNGVAVPRASVPVLSMDAFRGAVCGANPLKSEPKATPTSSPPLSNA